MQVLGVIDATIPHDGAVQVLGVSLANLGQLKNMAAGKHEFRVTACSAIITVATRLDNDGEIVAQFFPKAWAPPNAAHMKAGGASYRYINAQPWGVGLATAGDWTNVSNVGAYLYVCGYALLKDTQISVTFRGNVQFR